LYILALPGPIVSFFSPSKELLALTEQTMGVMGLALLLTSFTFAGKHQLDLFHALGLFHLIGLVGLSITTPKLKQKKSMPDRVLDILYYGGVLGFFIFQIYVFATAPSFGSQPNCNDNVKYVLFGINTQATNPVFRGLFLAMFGVMFLVFVITSIGDSDSDKFQSWLMRRALSARHGGTGLLWIALLFKGVAQDSDEDNGKEGYKLLGEVAGRSYVIAMLELMIQRNTTGSAGGEWGFGQILAIVLLIGPIIDLASGYSEPEDSKLYLQFKSKSPFKSNMLTSSRPGQGFTENDRLRFLLQRTSKIFGVAVHLCCCPPLTRCHYSNRSSVDL